MNSNKTSFFSPEQSSQFIANLKEAMRALDSVELSCRNQSIFDPLIAKQKSLIDQLRFISGDMRDVFKTEGETETLFTTMELFQKMTSSLKTLNKDNEQEFMITVDSFNALTQKHHDDLINTIKLTYSSIVQTQKEKKFIEKLLYGTTLAFYAGYLGSTIHLAYIIASCCGATIREVAKVAGRVCYPIAVTINMSRKLFNFAVSIFEVKNSRQIILEKIQHSEEIKEATRLIHRSFFLKLTSVILSAMAITAFTILLINPVGWGLAAVANVVDWLDSGIGGIKKAELEVKIAERALAREPDDQDAMKNLTKKQADLATATTTEKWIRTNMISMVLFACLPIPVVGLLLSGMGLAMFSVVAVRNIYVGMKPHIEEYKKAKTEKINPVEIELTTFITSSEKNISSGLRQGKELELKTKEEIKSKPVATPSTSFSLLGHFHHPSTFSKTKAPTRVGTSKIVSSKSIKR